MILIDFNNLGYAASAGQKLYSGSIETQGIYGTLKRIADIRQTYNGKILCLHDGRSWRHDVYPAYKANRRVEIINVDDLPIGTRIQDATKINQAVSTQVELANTWAIQKPYLIKILVALGIGQMFSSNLEADDLAARVTSNRSGEEHLLVTGDRDWYQLVNDKITWHCPIEYNASSKLKTVNAYNFEEATGYNSTFKFVQSKALTGDVGDNIPGVGGIGPKGAKWILDTYGSVEGFLNEGLTNESLKWAKKYQDMVDDPTKSEQFWLNMLLVDLKHPKVPKAIDTKLVLKEQNPDLFIDLCGELAFHSVLRRKDEYIDMFKN